MSYCDQKIIEHVRSNPLAMRYIVVFDLCSGVSDTDCYNNFCIKYGEGVFDHTSFLCYVIQLYHRDFRIGLDPSQQRHYATVGDHVRDNPIAVKYFILYGLINGVSVWGSFKNLYEIYGDDLIEYRDFEYWRMRFYRGELDMEYDRSNDPEPLHIKNLPDEILCKILEYGNSWEKMTMRQVSTLHRKLIDDMPIGIKSISIALHYKTVSIRIDDYQVQYWHEPTTTQKDKPLSPQRFPHTANMKHFRHDKHDSALLFLFLIFNRSVLQLESLSFEVHSTAIILQKFKLMFASLSKKISTTSVHIITNHTGGEQAILSHLKPETLETIRIEFETKVSCENQLQTQLRNLGTLEQCRKANKVWIQLPWLTGGIFPIEAFCETRWLDVNVKDGTRAARMPVEEVLRIKNVVKKSKMECFSIVCPINLTSERSKLKLGGGKHFQLLNFTTEGEQLQSPNQASNRATMAKEKARKDREERLLAAHLADNANASAISTDKSEDDCDELPSTQQEDDMDLDSPNQMTIGMRTRSSARLMENKSSKNGLAMPDYSIVSQGQESSRMNAHQNGTDQYEAMEIDQSSQSKHASDDVPSTQQDDDMDHASPIQNTTHIEKVGVKTRSSIRMMEKMASKNDMETSDYSDVSQELHSSEMEWTDATSTGIHGKLVEEMEYSFGNPYKFLSEKTSFPPFSSLILHQTSSSHTSLHKNSRKLSLDEQLKKDSTPIIDEYRSEIGLDVLGMTMSEIYTLKNEQFLDGSLIDYMTNLSAERIGVRRLTEKVQFASNQTFHDWISYKEEKEEKTVAATINLEKLAKNTRQNPELKMLQKLVRGIQELKLDFLSAKAIFLPVFYQAHWTFALIVNPKGAVSTKGSRNRDGFCRILFFNSLESDSLPTAVCIVVSTLIEEAVRRAGTPNQTFAPDKVKLIEVKNIPKQQNGTDCGLYVIHYIQEVMDTLENWLQPRNEEEYFDWNKRIDPTLQPFNADSRSVVFKIVMSEASNEAKRYVNRKNLGFAEIPVVGEDPNREGPNTRSRYRGIVQESSRAYQSIEENIMKHDSEDVDADTENEDVDSPDDRSSAHESYRADQLKVANASLASSNDSTNNGYGEFGSLGIFKRNNKTGVEDLKGNYSSKNKPTHYFVDNKKKKTLEIVERAAIDNNIHKPIKKIEDADYEEICTKIDYKCYIRLKNFLCMKCSYESGRLYKLICAKHPLFFVPDNVPSTEENPETSRAIQTCPDFFTVDESKIAGKGVFALETVSVGYVFGPYKGGRYDPAKDESHPEYSWDVPLENGGKESIDGFDEKVSNWMRYVNSPHQKQDANMVAFMRYGEVYYRVIKPIGRKKEALVWYGNEYGRQLAEKVADEKAKSAEKKDKKGAKEDDKGTKKTKKGSKENKRGAKESRKGAKENKKGGKELKKGVNKVKKGVKKDMKVGKETK